MAVSGRPAHGRQAPSARFARPGHAVTGDRSRTYAEKLARLGDDFFHAVVDDHSRLTHGELLGDERVATVTAFVERALHAALERQGGAP